MPSSLTCSRLTAWTLAAVLLQILGLALFMFAFFPLRPALSGVSGPESYVMPACGSVEFPDERIRPPGELRSLYNEISQLPSTFDRLVLMVVDGLPAEFILGREDAPATKAFIDAMPYTQNLLSSGRALAYHAIAAAPTVTMPRLKAIVSGGIGGFLDVAFNFNTQAMLDDNLIDQFHRCGLKMVMLGDETWARLFPGRFMRQDGVSSFYVKDTVEVDRNVSRHLKTELAVDDWDALILHYLGLDHVGHVGGRGSILMASKLKEMDDVIMMIDMHSVMKQHDEKRTLLVVLSDHGMTDRGNHGGSSFEEIDSLALFIGLEVKPTTSSMCYKTVNQVDIAPTLALLFGFPIPKNNVGVFIQEVLDQMTDEQRLRALELNSWQLLRLLQAHLPGLLCQSSCNTTLNTQDLTINESFRSIKEGLLCRFSNAMNLHCSLKIGESSKNISKSPDHSTSTIEAYYDFLRAASEWLSHSATNKPVIMILTGIIFMGFSCIILLVIILALFKEDCQNRHPSEWKVHRCRLDVDETFVVVAIIIHVVSLWSSSLVEEEQYTWHYLTSTLFLIFLFTRVQFLARQASNNKVRTQNCCLQQLSGQATRTNLETINGMRFFSKDDYNCNFISISSVVVVLICLRALRSWHQGGVNWVHLPDVSKFLEEGGLYRIKLFHNASLILLTSLSGLLLYLASPRKGYLAVLIASLFISSFLVFLHFIDYQNDDEAVSSYNLNLFHLFYGSVVVTLMIALASPWFMVSYQTKHQMNSLFTMFQVKSSYQGIRGSAFIIGVTYMISWCLLQLLLQRPINAAPISMLFLQILTSVCYFSSNGSSHCPFVELSALYFLGMCGHFGLGNTNNLAAIDVAGAFKGIYSQSTVLPGIMMFIMTYASPLLHLLSLILWISLKDMEHLFSQQASNFSCILQKMLGLPCLFLLALNSIPLTGFTITLFTMRNHLFIWSVFSPKYLYVCVGTVSVYIGLLLVAVTIFYICALTFYLRRKQYAAKWLTSH